MYHTLRRNVLNALTKAKNKSYIKMAVPIALVFVLVIGFFFGLQFVLGNSTPLRVVESGSMCVLYDGGCDGVLSITHEFSPTLHKGDIIIIQSVDPKTINANYPNSDIIVYQRPDNPDATPVVHRVVAEYEENGVLYFQTKGDGNDTPYPAVPSPSEYDSSGLWFTGKGVPQDMVLGKVVMRIPYLGWITLLLKANPWGLPAIIAIILLLLVLEMALPEIKRRRKTSPAPMENGVGSDFLI